METEKKINNTKKKKTKSAKLNKIIFIGIEMNVVLPMVSTLGVRKAKRIFFDIKLLKRCVFFRYTLLTVLCRCFSYLCNKNIIRFYTFFKELFRNRLYIRTRGEHHKNWCKRNFISQENIDRSWLE